MTISLNSVKEGGGNICGLKVVVARVYPLVYCVKTGQERKWMSQRDWEKWNMLNKNCELGFDFLTNLSFCILLFS